MGLAKEIRLLKVLQTVSFKSNLNLLMFNLLWKKMKISVSGREDLKYSLKTM